MKMKNLSYEQLFYAIAIAVLVGMILTYFLTLNKAFIFYIIVIYIIYVRIVKNEETKIEKNKNESTGKDK